MKKRLTISMILATAALHINAQDKTIKIFPEKAYQTMESFAASDAWSGNFVGKHWDGKEKAKIAEWLFSTECDDDGNPKGIGLSLWRVNLGAGTYEQTDADIMPVQRRAESFTGTDGKTYDWNKCAGQQYFMEQAVKYGCNNFLLFSNSPLVQYTLNNKGWSKQDNYANIKPDCYKKYAEYMADVASHFCSKGWNISYISPINEPQVNWDSPRQEGSPWRKGEIKKMFAALDDALSDKKELSKIKMLFGEAANLKVLYQQDDALRSRFNGKEAPDDLIKAYFDEKSEYYVGDLKHLPRIIAGHTYHNHSKNDELREVRRNVGEICKQYNVKYYQSEWCLLPNYIPPMDGFTSDWEKGNRGDIQVGLLMGRIIYSDVVDGNASSWGYWKGMEINGDYALVSLLPKDGSIFNGGTVSANKILWALGNYSFFIRPGFVRIDTEGADDINTVAASSYISPDGSQIVSVIVNSSFDEHDVKIMLPYEYEKRVGDCRVYQTNRDMNLSKGNVSLNREIRYVMPPRTLSTVVINLK